MKYKIFKRTPEGHLKIPTNWFDEEIEIFDEDGYDSMEETQLAINEQEHAIGEYIILCVMEKER